MYRILALKTIKCVSARLFTAVKDWVNGLSFVLVELKAISSKLWDSVVDLESRPQLDLENVNDVALVE